MIFKRAPDGEQIPALGLGTWGMGGGMAADHARDRETVNAIQAAIQLGYTHIDTAEMYGNGHTEELVGQAIRGLQRERLFLTTKVSASHLHFHDVIQSCQKSLQRLGTDYIDLYLVHWPNPNIPLIETLNALNELTQRGLVRYIGVSNFSLAQLTEAQALSAIPLATNQVPYSLTTRKYVQNGVLSYCQANNILLTAYSPIKMGELAHPVVREIAKSRNATPAQVALIWLVHQPQVITIPKSANLQHLKENLGCLDLDLSPEDVERLEQLK